MLSYDLTKKGRTRGASIRDSSLEDKRVRFEEAKQRLQQKAWREGWRHSEEYYKVERELWDSIMFEEFYRKMERKSRQK